MCEIVVMQSETFSVLREGHTSEKHLLMGNMRKCSISEVKGTWEISGMSFGVP